MIITEDVKHLPLPDWDDAGLLPHLIASDEGPTPRQSPYGCGFDTFKDRFGEGHHRRDLVEGLAAYRERIEEIGLTVAFQWVSGSIVERDAEPNDIDMVSFYWPPEGVARKDQMEHFARTYNDVFEKAVCRRFYGCDPNFVLLSNHPMRLVRATSYWLSLYSYSKAHGRSRGFVALSGRSSRPVPAYSETEIVADVPELLLS